MSKILCIVELTKTSSNEIDDIVGVFPDDHEFSSAEIETFKIVSVPFSKAEINEELAKKFDPATVDTTQKYKYYLNDPESSDITQIVGIKTNG